MRTKWLILATVFVVAGCATVYTVDDFAAYRDQHETVAILPYDVNITLKKLPEGMTEADVQQMEHDEAYVFQEVLYTQFLKRHSKGEYTVEFQDVDKTNVILTRADIDYEALGRYSKDELAQILGVDSVISGTIARSKPMSTGGAIASTIFFGFGTTNQVHVNMSIHCGETGDLLWSYDHEVSGGVGSSPESVAKSLMKDVAKKFPYRKT
jgi:hypothetical protein